jgi:hypothetical protein
VIELKSNYVENIHNYFETKKGLLKMVFGNYDCSLC